MSGADSALLSCLIGRARDHALQLQHLVRVAGADDPSLQTDLDELGKQIAAVTDMLQERNMRSWRRPGPHAAVSRRHDVPLSSALERGVPVQRFSLGGRPIAEAGSVQPAPSGIWRNDVREKRSS